MVEAGRVELPSANIPRKASTGLVQVLEFAVPLLLNKRDTTSHTEESHAFPLSHDRKNASLMRVATKEYQVSSFVTCPLLGHNPYCLRSVGVFVIVLGNYIFAAFYEASGASTCNFGFTIHVETNAPPFGKKTSNHKELKS